MTAANEKPWRVGRKVGRTLYIGDTLIGMVDTPVLAAQIVEAMNDHGKTTCQVTGSICGSLKWRSEIACECDSCILYKRATK